MLENRWKMFGRGNIIITWVTPAVLPWLCELEGLLECCYQIWQWYLSSVSSPFGWSQSISSLQNCLHLHSSCASLSLILKSLSADCDWMIRVCCIQQWALKWKKKQSIQDEQRNLPSLMKNLHCTGKHVTFGLLFHSLVWFTKCHITILILRKKKTLFSNQSTILWNKKIIIII